MKVLLNGKNVEVSNDLLKAINEQLLINDAISIMPSFDLIKPIEEFSRKELLKFSQLLENKMLENNGDFEWDTLHELSYIHI